MTDALRKVTVFGGSGFLGSYLTEELIAAGYSVTVADLKPSIFLSEGSYRFIECDISRREQVMTALEELTEHDYVFNLAGVSDLDLAYHEPHKTMNYNVLGNINILDACTQKKISRFVFASSAYASSSKGSFYGISKFVSEKVIEEYHRIYGLKFTIVRYGSLYGERADHHNGIYRLLKQAVEEKRLHHKGDGEEMREYIHARDAARQSVMLLSSDFENSHILLTGSERFKQKDVLYMIREILNDDVEISFTNEVYKGHYRVTPYSFRPDMARKVIVNPYIDFGQGLIECIHKIHGEKNEL